MCEKGTYVRLEDVGLGYLYRGGPRNTVHNEPYWITVIVLLFLSGVCGVNNRINILYLGKEGRKEGINACLHLV